MYQGDYLLNSLVPLPFYTAAAGIGSASISGVNEANVVVYKNGGSSRASTAGYTLKIDIDGLVGSHMILIDTSDNSDPGFYEAGARYDVLLANYSLGGQAFSTWEGSFGLALIKTQVVQALTVDTYGEPGQVAMPATASIERMLHQVYQALRNMRDHNDVTGEEHIYANNGVTVVQKATITKVGGITTRSEFVPGP